MTWGEIAAWLRSKNISAHSIAALLTTLAFIVVSDGEVRDFILKLFATHPKIGTTIIAVAGIVFKYSHSSSPAGAVAHAKEIMMSDKKPTTEQVLAADPKEYL